MKRTNEQWQDLFQQQAQSGLSISVFARQNGIKAQTFYSRRNLLKGRSASHLPSVFSRAEVISTEKNQPEINDSRITLVRGDVRLEIPHSISSAWVSELMVALS